ncbi:MAG: hypothetical protein ACR5K7_05505 [Symbiopectobacterium sp.]
MQQEILKVILTAQPKASGTLVYVTCSGSLPEENQQQMRAFLDILCVC